MLHRLQRPLRLMLGAIAATLMALLAIPVHADSVQVSSRDAHDGMMLQIGSTYYLYGTRYGYYSSDVCDATHHYRWGYQDPGDSWCGFGVWTSTNKLNWNFQRMLFDPAGTNSASPIVPGEPWQTTCNWHGAGCFNPRMVQRASDGVWILWFNAPADYSRVGANAYYAMGCAGPAGPCGDGAVPNGSVHKPSLWGCHDNGDFSIVNNAGTPYIACTMVDQTISIEQLDAWWTNGVQGSSISNVGGLTHVESPAIFGSGPYLYLTVSSPNCGYCSSDGTRYARTGGSGMFGTWTDMGLVSTGSCNGQPRSLNLFDGLVWEWIDQWTPSGDPNQAIAAIYLEGVHLDSNWNMLPFSDCP